jgi:hypothetical protein
MPDPPRTMTNVTIPRLGLGVVAFGKHLCESELHSRSATT